MTGTEQFYGFVGQDGFIYEWRGYGSTPSVIGVSQVAYNSLQEERNALDARCKNYFERLVELGVIKKPATIEEVSNLLELSLANQERMEAELKALKEAKNESSINNSGGAQRASGNVVAKSSGSHISSSGPGK